MDGSIAEEDFLSKRTQLKFIFFIQNAAIQTFHFNLPQLFNVSESNLRTRLPGSGSIRLIPHAKSLSSLKSSNDSPPVPTSLKGKMKIRRFFLPVTIEHLSAQAGGRLYFYSY